MRGLLSIAVCLFIAPALAQEKFNSSNVDVRTVLAFKASDAAVQRLLPEGWEINSPASGPAKGANLSLVLLEQVSVLDAEGKPTPILRGAVFVAPVKKKGSDAGGSMVLLGLITPPGAPGAYNVYMPAAAVTHRKQSIDSDGVTTVEESWSFSGPDGHAIEVQVAYERAAPARAKTESKTYSGAKPDFYRIYRVESSSDVARSVPNGVDRVQKISYKATGSKFTTVLDGTEQLIAVTSIPSYTRQVFLPGP